MSFDHAVIDPPGEPRSHGSFVFLYSSSKGLEFGKGAVFHLLKPGIKEFSRAVASHLGRLLHQVIGQIDLWVNLTECGHCLLLLGTQFFRAMKKQKGSLS